MAKLKMKEIQDVAKIQVMKDIQELAEVTNGIQFDNAKFAIPVSVKTGEGDNEQVVYVEIAIVAKNWNDTKTTDAFDPEVARENWLADIEFKKKVADQKLVDKNAKIERDKKARAEKAKAKEEVAK